MKTNWEIKRLGDVCEELFAGGDVDKNNTSKIKTDIFSIPIFSNGEKNKGLYGYTNVARVTKPSITISARGTIGYSEIRQGPFYPVVRLIVVIPRVDLVSLAFLKFVIDSIDFKHSGSSIPQLTVPMIKEYPIVLPPLQEQQQIVSILDEAFANLAKIKDNAEKNLKNAKELFESYLQNVFTDKSDGWEDRTLGGLSKKKDAVVSGPFGSNLKVSDYKDKGIPILRLQNIGKGYFIDKSIKYINKEKAEELKYHSFLSGDIALAKLGIPIGKTCIIPNHFKSGIITADIVRIRPDLNVVNYKFLEYFLNTNLSVAQLTSNISGATRPRVNLSDVRNIKLSLPPLKVQENIVKKLDVFSTETKRLETIYREKLNDLEELKKGILQKAFNGEL